jgi:hypothetical protein
MVCDCDEDCVNDSDTVMLCETVCETDSETVMD